MNYLKKAQELEAEITSKYFEIVENNPYIEFNKLEEFLEDWGLEDDSYLMYNSFTGESENVYLLKVEDSYLYILSTDRVFDLRINFSDIGSIEEKAAILDRIIF